MGGGGETYFNFAPPPSKLHRPCEVRNKFYFINSSLITWNVLKQKINICTHFYERIKKGGILEVYNC